MAKVLFVNPVIREESEPRHVPYGIALLAAITDRLGHQIQVLDANAMRPSEEQLVEVLKADDWDIIATGGITTAYGSIKRILRLSAEHSPNALRILGGGVITSMPHDIMRFLPEVQVGVVGEGFQTFPRILSMLDSRQHDWGEIKGIIWRRGDATVQLNPEQPLLLSIDDLPFPAWEMFP